MRLVGTDLICNYMASIFKRDQLYALLIYATLIFYKERRAKMAHVIWYCRPTLWRRWLRLTVSSVSLLRSEWSYSCSRHMLKKKKYFDAVLVRGKWDHTRSVRSLLMSGHGKNEQFLSHSSAFQQFSFCVSIICLSYTDLMCVKAVFVVSYPSFPRDGALNCSEAYFIILFHIYRPRLANLSKDAWPNCL